MKTIREEKSETMKNERPGAVAIQGKPLTLVGPRLEVGDRAPDFKVVNVALKEVTLGDLKKGVKIFSVIPWDQDFGLAYGVLIKELRLLTRAVFIADSDNVLRYVEYCKDIYEHVDYSSSLEAARNLAKPS